METVLEVWQGEWHDEKKSVTAVSLSGAAILAADGRNGLDSIRALQFENGTLQQTEIVSGPVFTDQNGWECIDLPPRTVVKLLLTPARKSHICVEIWLPMKDRWNGRFLGLGNSGAAGKINLCYFAQPLREGYAVVSADMGTRPNADSGIGNREVWKDSGYRATHWMTVEAKRVIRACYGRDPEFSYFS